MNKEWRPKIGERVQLSIFGWLDGEKGEVTEVTEQAGRVACSVKIKGLKDEVVVYVENVKPIEDLYPPPFLKRGDEVLLIGTRYHGEKGAFVEEVGLLGERRYAVQLLERDLTSLFERNEILPLKLFDARIDSMVKDALDAAFSKKAISDTVAPPSAPLGPLPIPRNKLMYNKEKGYIGLAPEDATPYLLVEDKDGLFAF